jgi:pimeloyl-ACP methyl ester carboxylesterase
VAPLRNLALAVLALAWLAPDARAAEIVTETLRLSGVYEALLARPAGPGRSPLIVVAHGATGDPGIARSAGIAAWSPIAAGFARQGFSAASFLRRGYGGSAGELAEGFGFCATPDYVGSAEKIADQIADVVAALKEQPYVDPTRIVVVGSSAGGFGALAYAARAPEGLVAVVSIAGGRGARPGSSVCAEPKLIEAFGHFGRSARAPTLWLYAENDSFFAPPLVRRLFAAWTGAGAKGELVFTPPFGTDGHFLFAEAGRSLWHTPIDDFFKVLKLP